MHERGLQPHAGAQLTYVELPGMSKPCKTPGPLPFPEAHPNTLDWRLQAEATKFKLHLFEVSELLSLTAFVTAADIPSKSYEVGFSLWSLVSVYRVP